VSGIVWLASYPKSGTTFRTHPVNYLALNASLGVAAEAAGFSPTTLLLAAPVFFFSGALTPTPT
jgi:hypothetical protein